MNIDCLEPRRHLSGGPATPALSASLDTNDPQHAIVLTYSVSDGSHLELEEKAPGDENFHGVNGSLEASAGSHTLSLGGLMPDQDYAFRLRADKDAETQYASDSVTTRSMPDSSLNVDLPMPTGVQARFDQQSYDQVRDMDWFTSFDGDYSAHGTFDYPDENLAMDVEAWRTDDPYHVLRVQAESGPYNFDDAGSDTHHEYDISLQMSGVSAKVRVRVVVEGFPLSEVSDFSAPFTVSAPGSQASPLQLDSAASSNGLTHLTWSGGDDDGTPYSVALFSVDDHAAHIVGYYPRAQGYADVQARDANTQFFAVYSNSGYSNFVKADGTTAAPAAPTNLSAATAFADAPCDDPSQNKVHLLWDNTPNDEKSFKVERSDDGGETFKSIKGADADETSVTDTGMKPGNYIYRIQSVNDAAESDWVTFSVGVWPPGILMAFDGTRAMRDHDLHNPDDLWFGDWNGETAIPQFVDRYNGIARQYYAGIGNVVDYPDGIDQLTEGAFALDAMRNVAAGLLYLGGRYKALTASDPDAVQHVPVDLVGYSRGAMQAVKLANVISQDGVPDPDSAYQQRVQQFIGNDPHGNPMYTYYWVTAYHNYFHPKIRFVGLTSPVYMTGLIDPILATVTFGALETNWGWDTSLPAEAHVVVLHDQDPNQNDPPRYEQDITQVNGEVLNSGPYPWDHGHMGLHHEVLDDLLDAANDVNVPVARSA